MSRNGRRNTASASRTHFGEGPAGWQLYRNDDRGGFILEAPTGAIVGVDPQIQFDPTAERVPYGVRRWTRKTIRHRGYGLKATRSTRAAKVKAPTKAQWGTFSNSNLMHTANVSDATHQAMQRVDAALRARKIPSASDARAYSAWIYKNAGTDFVRVERGAKTATRAVASWLARVGTGERAMRKTSAKSGVLATGMRAVSKGIAVVGASSVIQPGGQRNGQQVAQTILQQLGGTSRLAAMINAKNFIAYGPAGTSSGRGLGGVGFRFSNKARSKPNHVRIILEPNDTYTVSFGRIKGYDFKELRSVSGIYAGQLRDLIERETGLYLSLGTMGRRAAGAKGRKASPAAAVKHWDPAKVQYGPRFLGSHKHSIHLWDGSVTGSGEFVILQNGWVFFWISGELLYAWSPQEWLKWPGHLEVMQAFRRTEGAGFGEQTPHGYRASKGRRASQGRKAAKGRKASHNRRKHTYRRGELYVDDFHSKSHGLGAIDFVFRFGVAPGLASSRGAGRFYWSRNRAGRREAGYHLVLDVTTSRKLSAKAQAALETELLHHYRVAQPRHHQRKGGLPLESDYQVWKIPHENYDEFDPGTGAHRVRR